MELSVRIENHITAKISLQDVINSFREKHNVSGAIDLSKIYAKVDYSEAYYPGDEPDIVFTYTIERTD